MADRDAPCAVFVHGAGGGGWEWIVWQRVLAARGWTVLAADLRPCAAGLAATRFDDYLAQVRAWCAGCSRPFALIGASLGGLLAARAATVSGSGKAGAAGGIECAALVLINPLAPAGIASDVRLHATEPHAGRPDRGALVPWGRERSLAGTRRSMPDADDAACLFAFRRWRDESAAVLRDAQAVALETPRRPTLVIAGERDQDCPADVGRALATRLDADFRLLKGASHLGPLLGRDAAIVAADTLRWLESRMAGERRNPVPSF